MCLKSLLQHWYRNLIVTVKRKRKGLIKYHLEKLTGFHSYTKGTTSQSHTAAGGNVTFDNFVQACVTVKTLTDSFRAFDTDQDGWVQINYEQV
jgi:Ca2+-binding EF-hand superfamily protein